MSKKSDSTLRIVMVGDVIITEAIDPQIAFGNTLPILQNGDITNEFQKNSDRNHQNFERILMN